MAINFLAVSKTYRENTLPWRKEIDDFIAVRLSDTYRLPRGSAVQVLHELGRRGTSITRAQLTGHVRRFRLAYLLLNGDTRNALDVECAEKEHVASEPYRALKKDGITSWSQVVKLLEKGTKAETETKVDAPKVPAVEAEMQPSARYVVVLKEELDALVTEQVTFREELSKLSLRLRALEEHQEQLEPMAVEVVSVPTLVQKAAAEGNKHVSVVVAPTVSKASGAQSTPEVFDELPKTSSYRGITRPTRYEKAFLERMKRMDVTAARQVLKAVQAIARDHVTGGLQVKPLTPPSLARDYSKNAVYSARASKKTRIVFEPSKGALVFHDLLSKGAIRRTSEF